MQTPHVRYDSWTPGRDRHLIDSQSAAASARSARVRAIAIRITRPRGGIASRARSKSSRCDKTGQYALIHRSVDICACDSAHEPHTAFMLVDYIIGCGIRQNVTALFACQACVGWAFARARARLRLSSDKNTNKKTADAVMLAAVMLQFLDIILCRLMSET